MEVIPSQMNSNASLLLADLHTKYIRGQPVLPISAGRSIRRDLIKSFSVWDLIPSTSTTVSEAQMHSVHLTAVAAALLIVASNALAVNWYVLPTLSPIAFIWLTLDLRYSDQNCAQYLDTTSFSGKGIHGNYQSAGSALFASDDGCPGTFDCPTRSFCFLRQHMSRKDTWNTLIIFWLGFDIVYSLCLQLAFWGLRTDQR